MTEEHTPACTRSCVIYRQSDNGFPLLLSVHLVLSWQRLSSDVRALLLAAIVYGQFCDWNVYSAPRWKKKKRTTIYLLCFVTFFPPLFGENNLDCTIKNYRLWIFPQIINSTSEEKCHLLFNAWLLGLMAGSLILKVESLFGNNILNLRRFNKRRGVF